MQRVGGVLRDLGGFPQHLKTVEFQQRELGCTSESGGLIAYTGQFCFVLESQKVEPGCTTEGEYGFN